MDSELRGKTSISEEEKIEIGTLVDDMWKGFKLYWWLFLLIVSLTASTAYFASRLLYKPTYRAYSTFTVKTVEALGYSTTNYNQTVAKQLGEVFPYLLTSDVLNKLVAEDIGLDQVPGKVSASSLESTNLITLSVEADNGQLAYDILQSVIRNYPRVSDYVIGNIALTPMDESGVPASPSNQVDFRRRAELGAFVGAVLCLLWLLLYALTRMTIRSEDDLRKVFNIPCLGAVPMAQLKKRSRKEKGGLTIDAKGAPYIFIESIRTVRNRVERESAAKDIKTILVTSALPSEGKTTVAVNLALSLAHKERKVILVDADMRSPAVAAHLGMDSGDKGFADLLEGKATLKESVRQYRDFRNFGVIAGGKARSDPAGLLNSDRIHQIVEILRNAADYVIFDTPPSSVVSDAAELARNLDGGVFVVMQDYAKVDVLQEGMEMFPGSGVKMIGCVLNATTASLTGSGYGYGRYGYGNYGSYGKKQGYGYVYGEQSGKKKKQ